MSRPTFAGTTVNDYRAPGKSCANVRRGDLPKYIASIPVLRAWMRGYVAPTRAEQDVLAEDIRSARVTARVTIALAGPEVCGVYCAALRSFLLPGDEMTRRVTTDEAAAWGVAAGTKARFTLDGVFAEVDGQLLADAEVGRTAVEARERCGNQNRGSAGKSTRNALRLLTLLDDPTDANSVLLARSAADLDLDADPSCRALDAARETLQARPQTLQRAEAAALESILGFERAIGRAQHALRGHVVEVLRLASMADHLEGPFGGDALTGGAEGQRRAFRVYRRNGPGDLCLGSFARTHWIVQGAVQALRGMWPDSSEAGRQGIELLSLQHTLEEQGGHACEIGKGGQVPRSVGVADNIVGDEGVEAKVTAEEMPLVLRHILGCLGEGADPARAVLREEIELFWTKSGELSKRSAKALPARLLQRLRQDVYAEIEPEVYRPRGSHSPWKPRAPEHVRTIVASPVQRQATAWEPWGELRELCAQAFS